MATCGRTRRVSARDLARCIHAELVNAVDRVAWQRARARAARPSDCCGWRRCAWVGACARQHMPQRLLGAGLADAAGDRGDPGAARAPARPVRARSAPPWCPRPGPAGHRPAGPRARGRPARPRALASAAATKSWPSCCGPRRAMNSSPGRTVANSIATPATDQSPRGASAGRGGELGRGPERLAHAGAPLSSASAAAHLDRVVERQHAIAHDLPGLVALAGDHQEIARLEPNDRGRGSRPAGRRSRRRPGRHPGSRAGSLPGPRCADCRR